MTAQPLHVGPNGCYLTSECTHFPHAASDHPCGRMCVPGELCAYCGKPTPMDGSACPTCWISLEGLAFADIKALLARADLSADRPEEQTR